MLRCRSPRTRLNLERLESRVVPATFTVTNADDAGAGSLREAILEANASLGADDVVFNTFFTTPRTIALTAASGQLTISEDLIVTGPGAGLLTINGGGVTRVFNADGTGILNVKLSGMIVTGGNGSTGGAAPTFDDGGGIRTANENLTLEAMVITGNSAGINDGGGVATGEISSALLSIRSSNISGNVGRNGAGIYILFGGGLFMVNSTVSGNIGTGVAGGSNAGGGGIYFFGTVAASGFTIRNSTIAGNTTDSSGGGLVFTNFTGTALIQNSTITGNTASRGGGISVSSANGSATLTLVSTIVSGNTATNGTSDVFAIAAARVDVNFSAIGDPDGFTTSISSGNNLAFGAVLNLLPLASNGGPTPTIALGVGSAAVNAGSNPSLLVNDQRGPGFPRSLGAGIDIGAFEGIFNVPTATGGPYGNLFLNVANYAFTVTYTSTTPINVSTLDNNDVRVTGPNGFSQLATFITVTPAGNGSPRTATYSTAGPGGSFGGEDNGTYTITVQAGQVANTSGATASATAVGTFKVGIPQTFTVTNLNDAGAGSLRQAIFDANTQANIPDTIVFQAGLTGTIALTQASGQLSIRDSVTITGPGAGSLTVSGGGVVRIFFLSNLASVIDVAITGMTIAGGAGIAGSGSTTAGSGGGIVNSSENLTLDGVVLAGNGTTGGSGGGIFNAAGSTLTVRNCTIAGNTAFGGGGINFPSNGSLLLVDSTVSGNTAEGGSGGGGVQFFGGVGAGGFTIRNSTFTGNNAYSAGGGVFLGVFTGTALIENSTITGNSVATTTTSGASGGGGIAAASSPGVLTLRSTIVSGNTAPAVNGRSDIATDFAVTVNANFCAIGDPDGFLLSASSSANLSFGISLGLGALGNNGGPTQTIAVAGNSPLVSAGFNAAALTTDQRGPGFPRVSGAAIDIGAFEVQAAAPTAVARINDGSAQRSRITSLTVTFSAQVMFAGSAFTLTRTGGGPVNFTETTNIVGGVTVVTLNALAGAETQSGSLRDGRYTLTVLANQISAGGVNMAANYTLGDAQGLFRFYGDTNGDRRIDISDFGFFSLAYLTLANYNAALDFNNDGRIDIADFGQFSVRFFTTLP